MSDSKAQSGEIEDGEAKFRAKVDAAIDKLAKDGTVSVRVTMKGEGAVHTGEGRNARADQGAELTVPTATARKLAYRGLVEPVAPAKSTKG